MSAAPQAESAIFIDVDPYAPHDEDCAFWDGGFCQCKPEAREALERTHCHECDFVNAVGMGARCNCVGKCICERLEGCPCVGHLDAPLAHA